MSIRLFHTQRLRACCCGGDSGGADASHGAASRTIALAGNQNCGKTTLFNLLTGRHQHTGNWPGVTVERVSGRVAARNWEIVDLPGLYALSPYSAEEVVSREFLESPACDVILNVVDVTHPERSLGLTLELMLLGKPMVVVLNMCDLVSDELRPSPQKLAQELGVPVVLVSAASGTGLEELYAAVEQARVPAILDRMFTAEDAACIRSFAEMLDGDGQRQLFDAVGLLRGDERLLERHAHNEQLLIALEQTVARLNAAHGMPAEVFIAGQRFSYIDALLKRCRKPQAPAGDTAASAAGVSAGAASQAVLARMSRRIDALVLNRYLALPLFCAIIYLVYFLAVSTIGTWGTDYANDVIFGQWCTDGAAYLGEKMALPAWMMSLIEDGVIAGVGAVLGFVPQMIVLFLLLAFIEQCGYMTRVAFVLDRIFRHFGLSGSSVFPLLLASGCGVPALMSTRSIGNLNEQRTTLMTTTFMPCSAKLPIITMICLACLPGQIWVAPLIYVMAVAGIAVTGIILNKGRAFKTEVAPFVLELPDYHLPRLRNLLLQTYERCRAFVIKAGTVIFGTVVAVWFLSNFGFGEDGFGMCEIGSSILARLGAALAFIFAPLGFGSWQATVAVFTGLLAKENVVGTLAVLLGVEGAGEEDAALSVAVQGLFPSAVAAFAYLSFNLWSPPCVAALGAMKRQFGSSRWFAFAFSYMLLYAYALALIIYQLGGLLLGVVPLGPYTLVALVVLAVGLYLLFRPDREGTVPLRIPSRQV